ncbi:MAG: prepilin-type N-terminal cleavage/methylation domain-containing protein [Candidatus Omnitrophica bacterium]|nr:prepilin-type N-terminal cleavage/methylation domain-containing protein [Candidatus Omnitrophota bacterium]
MKKIISNTRAFTLIELLMTLAILGLVLFPLYEFLRQAALAWQTGETKTEVVQNARSGVDKLCDELRQARALYVFSPAAVSFWWEDLDDDEIADPNEIITYAWSGTSGQPLLRQLDSEAAASPLANHIDNFQLLYHNASGAQTSVAAEIKYIAVFLRTKKIAGGQTFTTSMHKAVGLRNL